MELEPGMADCPGRCSLAGMLLESGRPEESAAEYRAALQIDPSSYAAHYGLGYALFVSGSLEEAGEELRRAIAIDSRSFAHESLGHVLADLGQRDEAITCLREAVRLDPKRPGPRRALILSLIERGSFDDARREADALVRTRAVEDPERAAAQAFLDHCSLLIELEDRLPAFLDGTRDPQSSAESLALADLFRSRQDHAEAARWYGDAFDGEAGASLAEGEGRRFAAARCAALAGTIDGPAVEAGGGEARAQQRTAALAWLRADLASLDVALVSGAPGSRRYVLLCLGDFRSDPAFAGVRDGGRIDRLPEVERGPWRSLWSDADALSARARRAP
jgi:tetratricopeptide (TPR) repeat protein